MNQKPVLRMSGIMGVLIAASVLAWACRRAPRAAQATATPAPTATPALALSATLTPSLTPSPAPTSMPTGAPAVALDADTFFVALDGDDANPGSYDRPWATLNHAAETLRAGQTVYVRGGVYALERQVRFKNAGAQGAWITYAAYPGETPLFDAGAVQIGPPQNYPHDKGTLNIEGVGYIRVIGLGVRRSYQMGITVRDSQHIEIVNNRTDTTFGPGIGVWDSNADGKGTEYIKVLGNTVTRANTWEMLPEGYKREGEPPHEAISIAGAQHFEVAYNYVYDTDKEGIDIKEVSKHGTVHHNYVRGADRQGLYIDAWFGAIEDIEVYENVVHRCRMSGMILSVENGKSVSNVRIHHNLFFENLGTGFFFSRWGDGPRTDIQIYNNTIYCNGIGAPGAGARYYWMTGGLYLFSNNLAGIDIRHNIIAENAAFQIGYSDHWLEIDPDIERAFAQKRITVDHNLIYQSQEVEYPLYLGWGPDMYANVWSYTGTNALEADPLFVDPRNGDFRPRPDSPAVGAVTPGALPTDAAPDFWWLNDFPPVLSTVGD